MAFGDEYTNIEKSLGLNTTQWGLCTGTVFTFTNGITGLFWGHVSDKVNRKWMLFIASLLWTACSVGISFTQSYW